MFTRFVAHRSRILRSGYGMTVAERDDMTARAVLAWFGLLVLAFANATLREKASG